MSINIETAASSPKKASNENGSLENHSLKEIIDADRYNRANAAAATGKSPFAMGLTKGISPGCR